MTAPDHRWHCGARMFALTLVLIVLAFHQVPVIADDDPWKALIGTWELES